MDMTAVEAVVDSAAEEKVEVGEVVLPLVEVVDLPSVAAAGEEAAAVEAEEVVVVAQARSASLPLESRSSLSSDQVEVVAMAVAEVDSAAEAAVGEEVEAVVDLP